MSGLMCLVSCSSASPNGQSGEYSIPTTTGLKIEQTVVELLTSKNNEGSLRKRIADRFSQAGLPVLSDSQKITGQDVTLRFTQQEIPLDPTCPKKVFYMARRELIEPVTIKRSDERIIVGHWDVANEPEIRDPVPIVELESNLDRQLGTFLYNYQLGKNTSALYEQTDDIRNRAGGTRKDSTHNDALQPRKVQRQRFAPSYDHLSGDTFIVMEEEVWGSLRGLSMENVFFDKWDKSYTGFRPMRDQLLKAQLVPRVLFSEVKDPQSAAKLVLTMEMQPLNDMCPGNVLYKSGLALREQVFIERNGIQTWADSWGSYRVEIRRPLSEKEFDNEQLRLISQFITDYYVANPRKRKM